MATSSSLTVRMLAGTPGDRLPELAVPQGDVAGIAEPGGVRRVARGAGIKARGSAHRTAPERQEHDSAGQLADVPTILVRDSLAARASLKHDPEHDGDDTTLPG